MTGTISINRRRLEIVAAVAIVMALMMLAGPAHAQDAFAKAGDTITKATQSAIDVAKKVLLVAAVLALIVGLAPMLWGQVKVKWIISALCACTLFGLADTIVAAFAS